MNTRSITFDYEDTGDANSYWHIYSTDYEPDYVTFCGSTIMTIRGPDTPELFEAISRVCETIEAAILLAQPEPQDR